MLELAARHFGVLGDTVLESWGIHASEDIGRIVSELVEYGAVSLSDDDRIEDFGDLFRVDQDFAARYRIGEGLRSGSGREADGARSREGASPPADPPLRPGEAAGAQPPSAAPPSRYFLNQPTVSGHACSVAFMFAPSRPSCARRNPCPAPSNTWGS